MPCTRSWVDGRDGKATGRRTWEPESANPAAAREEWDEADSLPLFANGFNFMYSVILIFFPSGSSLQIAWIVAYRCQGHAHPIAFGGWRRRRPLRDVHCTWNNQAKSLPPACPSGDPGVGQETAPCLPIRRHRCRPPHRPPTVRAFSPRCPFGVARGKQQQRFIRLGDVVHRAACPLAASSCKHAVDAWPCAGRPFRALLKRP